MIKVCEIISDTNIGGAGRLLVTRLSVSDRERFNEVVVLPRTSKLCDCFKDIGIKLCEMNYCADSSFDMRAIPELVQVFKREKPDIVNCHGCLSARIAAYIVGVPIRIYTRHCAFVPSKIMTNPIVKRINRSANRLLNTRIIAVADAAAQNLIDMGVSSDQIDIVINGVLSVERYSERRKKDMRECLDIPKDSFVCGISARLEDCKGIDCLLRAAKELLQKDKRYFFMIVGSGSKEKELRSLASSLGVEENIKFCGFVNDITPYVNCFDLNINCSRGTETSSLALSEGMSIGLPCIASDFGGNPYMVRDGYNGFIYPTDDHIALAKRISLLSLDKELYRQMSKNAYERYKNELNAENMARKTEEIYSSLFLARMSKNYCKSDRKIDEK